jgi:probable selenium-dependent hydroxylase accessory protein YqeC
LYDSVMARRRSLSPLWDALNLDTESCPVVAVVGGGGKSTLIYRLGVEAAALGKRAVLTGTTRFTQAENGPYPRAVVVDERSLPSAVASALKTEQVVVASTGHLAKERLAGLISESIDALAAMPGVGLVAIHADGSRQRPFKAPGRDEPVIPEAATHVVAVVGLDALGAPIDAIHVHRPEAVRALAGNETHCDASVIARAMLHDRGGRKGVSARHFIVAVNKCAADPAAADALARALLTAGAPRVVTTELHDAANPVRGVLTS